MTQSCVYKFVIFFCHKTENQQRKIIIFLDLFLLPVGLFPKWDMVTVAVPYIFNEIYSIFKNVSEMLVYDSLFFLSIFLLFLFKGTSLCDLFGNISTIGSNLAHISQK